ncbi:Transcription factor PfmaH [Paramyrothecium foliicola]|nr:Transcription factor PfmaH [Paramyrothecium foliicola]
MAKDDKAASGLAQPQSHKVIIQPTPGHASLMRSNDGLFAGSIRRGTYSSKEVRLADVFARYARRSSKAAVRAAQARAHLRNQIEEQQPHLQQLKPLRELSDGTVAGVNVADDCQTLKSENTLVSSPLTVDTSGLSDSLETCSPHEWAAQFFAFPTHPFAGQDEICGFGVNTNHRSLHYYEGLDWSGYQFDSTTISSNNDFSLHDTTIGGNTSPKFLKAHSGRPGFWTWLEHRAEYRHHGLEPAIVAPITQTTFVLMRDLAQSLLMTPEWLQPGELDKINETSIYLGEDYKFTLPSTHALEYLANLSFEGMAHYFTLDPGTQANLNEMSITKHSSSLLALIIVAHGASMISGREAQGFSLGLTEACRIRVFEMIDKEAATYTDSTSLRCALLLTVIGAWSGETSLVENSIARRGFYLMLLKYANFQSSTVCIPATQPGQYDIEPHWLTWLRQESRCRLFYAWVMADQELGLFHDTSTILSVTDLRCPVPGPEALWKARSSAEWLTAIRITYPRHIDTHNWPGSDTLAEPCLFDLFQDFMHENRPNNEYDLTSQQLRLLLHPLQSLVWHVRSAVSLCVTTPMAGSSAPTAQSSPEALSEKIDHLLERWPLSLPPLRDTDDNLLQLFPPTDALNYGIMTIDEGPSSYAGDEIKRELTALRQFWTNNDFTEESRNCGSCA